ncbi:MAG TPA: prepilin-type N-terminal cleavage/methylation domain-containing protein [Candidatus Paceibacterota bacterium]|nr:prepilin-type N-terminal cleavage/methylation domain-containing protein [Candidatus Paceibacterota bacterium]
MKKNGFTLIEVLIYTAIFAVSAVFLVGILTAITRVQSRQASVNEVNEQISFVNNTIQRLVRSASLVDMDSGSATTTLKLRMASSTLDPTLVYVDASSTAIYLQEGTSTAVALTDSKVSIVSFLATKFENPGGPTIVQVDLAMEYNTENIQAKAARSLKTAITKISAATFDSGVYPNANNSYDIGSAAYYWKDAYIQGGIGLGTAPVSAVKIKSNGDIGFASSSAGIIFVAPGGSCFRLYLSNSGNVATTTAACP